MLRLAGATASMLTIVHARLAPNLPPGSPDISPSWTPTWDASESSYLYWCNWSGPVYTPMVSNWSIVSLDWSDWKWGPLGWAAAQPMDNEERLYADAINIVANSRRGRPKAWVYRNSCKALPWYSSVRAKLESPAHRSWFLSYGPPSINGSYYSPPCDPYSGKCSTLYHDSTQSPDYTRMPACPITGDCSVQVPGYPSGDGNCSAPACDVGSIPVGEYVFDPRAWNTSVNGQTLGEWWLEEYLFSNTAGGNPNITGFYFDDAINDEGLCSELDSHQAADLGLTASEGAAIAAAYRSNFAYVYAELVARGAYTEQQFTKVSAPGNRKQCVQLFRDSLCLPQSPPALFVNVNDNTVKLSFAVYLLGRGPYGFFGHTWEGCGSANVNEPTVFPVWHADLYDADYGVPTGQCRETAAGSGVFERLWSHAYVAVDCNDLAVNITLRG